MRALTHIYSQRVPGIKKIPIGFDPKQERSSNPERITESMCRSTGRSIDPCPRSTVPIDRDQPRVVPFNQSTAPVDHSFVLCHSLPRGRPCYPVHVYAHRPTFCFGLQQVSFSLLLAFGLCAIFLMSLKNSSDVLLSPLSPLSIILHFGEDFSNLSRTLTNTWRNQYMISTKSTHDLGLSSPNEIDTRFR